MLLLSVGVFEYAKPALENFEFQVNMDIIDLESPIHFYAPGLQLTNDTC